MIGISYSAQLICAGPGGVRTFSAVASVVALLGFCAGFMILARLLHRASQSGSR